jgi:signal transduction histidine kinase/ActR/RegA family two-component response regulator
MEQRMSSNLAQPIPPEDNAEQRQALESLGIVVGEIAHDFNNILSLIFGYVEMAMSEIPEGERARSDLEHVLAAGDRAKELVARILTFSNRAKLKKTAINARLPVLNALNYLKDRMPPTVNLKSNITEQAVTIVGNDTEIQQMVVNLCNNSVQAMPPQGGSIDVTLAVVDEAASSLIKHAALPKGSYLFLSVKDTGTGMDLATMEKMYTPFFTTSRQQGRPEIRAGLGLTTVYNIVSSANGFIFADSELNTGTTISGTTFNSGTTFEIYLPLETQRSVQAEATPITKPATAKKVLFIDDEPAITEMASQILKTNGYQAKIFNDGNEALRHFAENPHEFDIIVTDLIMPLISGSELATRCAAINPNIPIVLTTGFGDRITPASFRQWGVTTLITKPFSIHQLLATLAELTKR